MKKCSNKNCPNVNPQAKENFAKDIRNSDKLQSQCKTCKYASNKRWEAANKDKIAAYERSPERIARHKETTLEWREKNKDRYTKYMREYHKKVYGTERLYRYNLSRDRYNEMLKEQDNKCAICKKPNKSKKRCLAIDHHHASGQVRGILCYNCNRLLHAFDNVDLYEAIMAYLEKWRNDIKKESA